MKAKQKAKKRSVKKVQSTNGMQKQVNVLSMESYKGYDFIIQNYDRMFQYWIYKPADDPSAGGEWLSNYTIVTPLAGKEHILYTRTQLEHGRKLIQQQVIATIETLIHKDNPQELLDKNEQAAGIVEVMEANPLPVEKPENKLSN